MNTKNNAPTLEEFKEAVFKRFAPLAERTGKVRHGGPTAAEFMETEDATFAIKDNYESSLSRFNKGEITRDMVSIILSGLILTIMVFPQTLLK